MRSNGGILKWLWETAPAAVPLNEREVHVWAGCLDASDPGMPLPDVVLSKDERERAARYRLERDRNRFAAGRVFLRRVLSSYVGVPAECIEFAYGPHGKPRLAGARSSIRFNVSHSEGLIVCAIGLDRELGIDVEAVRPMPELEEIARRFFSVGEVDGLLALSAEMKLEGFFNCWTRKEAYLKARGDGIGDWLDRFEVSLEPETPACLRVHHRLPNEVNCWSLRALKPAAGFIGALAVQGGNFEVRCRTAGLPDSLSAPAVGAVNGVTGDSVRRMLLC